jgi:hypothetical protein
MDTDAPERQTTTSTPAAVSSNAPAHAVNPADQPSTDTLNERTLAPYQGKNDEMKATSAPPAITRSSVVSRFQSNCICSTSWTSA